MKLYRLRSNENSDVDGHLTAHVVWPNRAANRAVIWRLPWYCVTFACCMDIFSSGHLGVISQLSDHTD